MQAHPLSAADAARRAALARQQQRQPSAMRKITPIQRIARAQLANEGKQKPEGAENVRPCNVPKSSNVAKTSMSDSKVKGPPSLSHKELAETSNCAQQRKVIQNNKNDTPDVVKLVKMFPQLSPTIVFSVHDELKALDATASALLALTLKE